MNAKLQIEFCKGEVMGTVSRYPVKMGMEKSVTMRLIDGMVIVPAAILP